MTGRLSLLLALCLTACLDWEPVEDGESAGDPHVPPLRHVTPAGLPPIFDPGGIQERCHSVCLKYVECYGPVLDLASCESLCVAEFWVSDTSDLACFLSAGCSELYLCYQE